MHSSSTKATSANTKAKVVPKVKAKPQKLAANSRFNYFVQCKHDLKHAATCPMCKLVTMVTRKHFDDEREKLERAHEQSLINRAQLRMTLMMRWARCQSALYNKFVSTPTFDVVFSKSLALLLVDEDAVNSRPNPVDFDEIVKILNRRNRIQEVGHFAALFLQTRIRKYLAKRYVRRLMLKRFEYVPATRRKDAFYVDNHWMRKWIRTPRYLQNEIPATPRTLGRRIAADDRAREARFDRYQKAIARQFDSVDDVWAQEETTVRFLKQLGILRDVVRIAMLNLTRSQIRRTAAAAAVERTMEARRAAGAGSTNSLPTSGSTPNARRASVMGRSAFAQVLQEETQKQQTRVPELEVDAVDIPLQPVWICLSAPACSARQLGLQLALATVPSPATGAVAVRTEGDGIPRCSAAAGITTTGGILKQGPQNTADTIVASTPMLSRAGTSATVTKLGGASGLGSSVMSMVSMNSGSGKTTAPRMQGSPPRSGTPGKTAARKGSGAGTITGAAQLHRALQFLEHSIWQCLKCSTPEEVLGKLVLEDLRPTVESVMNISQEPKHIWHGEMGYQPHGVPRTTERREAEDTFPGESGASSALVSLSADDNSSVGSFEEIDGEDYSYEVLPLTLQLRPYYPDRGCNGFFRLFFYMDELVVATACSPWAFYPEVTAVQLCLLVSCTAKLFRCCWDVMCGVVCFFSAGRFVCSL
jgi:hypothetical protein